jgi:hypothetical protein
VYQNEKEVGVDFNKTITEKQLDSLKKSLNPNGGEFYWDGPYKKPNGVVRYSNKIEYNNIEDGIAKIDRELKPFTESSQSPGKGATLKDKYAEMLGGGTTETLSTAPKMPEQTVAQPNATEIPSAIPKTGEAIQSSQLNQSEQLLGSTGSKTASGGISGEGGQANQSSDGIIAKVKDKVNKLYTQALDRFHPLSQIAHKAGEDVAMRRALTGYYGSGSTAQYHVDFELAPILKSTNIDELRKAAIMQRDAELAGRGIKGSGQNINMEVTPQTQEALNKLYAYQDNLVKEYLVKNQIMTEAEYDAMKAKNQNYVPFKRVMDNVDEWLGVTPQNKGAGSVGSQSVIKGIKGSDREIHDPLETIIENTYKIVGLGKRQEVARTIVGLKDKLPEGMIQKVEGKLPFNKNTMIALFENGKVEHYIVPQEVADAAKGMSEEQMNMLVNILAAPTRVFRATATGINPEFALPNVTRDLQSAFVNVGVNPLKWASGLAHMMKQDQVYQDFLKSGGMTSRISLDRPFLKKTVEDLSGKTPALRITDPRRLYSMLQALGQYSEQPTRIAAFQKGLSDSQKAGASGANALADAAYAAQEGTVNFARRGSKTQSLNAVYAFLNARAQGTDRLIRSIKADPKGAGVRLGMIAVAPAVATYAWNRQYPSYFDPNVVPNNVKQNNYVIMLSDTPIPQLGGAQYVMIPKGDVGKLANPVENFLSYADGKGGDIQGSLLSVLSAFSPIQNTGDLIPTALRPPIENAANYNFFYDRPIVPESKKNYPAPYQTSKSTPAIYKQAGQFLNQSPNMIENLSRGYLTGFARLGEMATQPFSNKDTYSGADVNQTPIIRRFFGGQVSTPEEAKQNDYYKAEGIQKQIQDIMTGIKYGNIPRDEGVNEIKKLQGQLQTENTQTQSYFGPQGASAAETSNDPLQKKIDTSLVKVDVQTSGKTQMVNGIIYYPNAESGEVNTFDLNPETKGTGIGAFANSDWKADKAATLWNNDKIPQDVKNDALKQLGVSPEDARYAGLTKYGTDVSTQYIISKSPDHQALLNNLLTGRVVSISGQQFASNAVIDSLNEKGYLSDEEAKQLKALKLDKKMNNIAKAKKGRKLKFKAVRVPKVRMIKGSKFKIKSPHLPSIQLEGSKKYKVKKKS